MGGFGGDGTATEPLRQIDLENTEKVEGKDEHNRAHEKHEIGVGELRRPDGLTSRSLNQHENKCQTEKPDENSADEGEAAAKNTGAALPGLLHKTENFQ